MPTALVVDDSIVDRRLAGSLLETECDFTVFYAADGKEALEQLQQRQADLVLTDLQMPELDGLELVTAVKEEYPLIPVILMTAKGSEDIAAQALQKGAASYVPKNILADVLPQTVSRVLAACREDRKNSRLLHHLHQGEMEFVLQNDLSLVNSLVGYLQEMLRCLPLRDETERLRAGIGLEEALKNAYFGNLEIGSLKKQQPDQEIETLIRQRRQEQPYCDRKIHVAAKVCRDEAIFIIRDEGAGFDHSQLANLAALTEDTSGRGLVLMRTVMDAVSFNAAGNEVTLVKRPAPQDQQGDE